MIKTVRYEFDIYQLREGKKTILKSFLLELPQQIANEYIMQLAMKTARALGFAFPYEQENSETGIEYRMTIERDE